MLEFFKKKLFGIKQMVKIIYWNQPVYKYYTKLITKSVYKFVYYLFILFLVNALSFIDRSVTIEEILGENCIKKECCNQTLKKTIW